ncbi:MAG: dCTP deaminase [Bdellovibrionales bacterium]|nr:dCTP deaminase [Bdellovibrionales bacterium]
MILSDRTIKSLLKEKKLFIKALSPQAIQPSSIDLTLDSDALILKHWNTKGVLDLNSKVEYQKIISKNEIIIPAHSFVLATTKEFIELPSDVSGFVEGRSSIGRMGLFIQNASVVGPGFKGKLTLELYNANILPISLKPGRRICQLILFQMDQPAERSYKGKYQGQNKTTPTKAFLDNESKKKDLKRKVKKRV